MYYTAALLATTCLLNTDLIKGAQTLVFSESVAKTKLRWIQTEFDTNCIELSVVNAWTLRVWLTVTFVHYLSIGTLAADTARGTAWFVTRLISRHHLARFPAHALAENLSRGTLCKKMKIPNLWYFQNSTKFTISVSGMVIYIWRSVTLWSFFRVLNILRNFNRIYWWLCGVLHRVTYRTFYEFLTLVVTSKYLEVEASRIILACFIHNVESDVHRLFLSVKCQCLFYTNVTELPQL